MARLYYIRVVLVSIGVSGCAIGGGDEIVMPNEPSEPMPVACVADYQEAFDADNGPRDRNLLPEPTMLALGGATAFSLCGELNGAFADPLMVDQDFFAFTIGGEVPLDVRALIQPALPATPGTLTTRLWTSRLGLLQMGLARGATGVVTRDALPPGSYLFSVDLQGAAPAAPTGYTVTVGPDVPPCEATGPLLPELLDITDGRGNDAVAVRFNPALVAELSTAAADAPEPTGVVLSPGQSARIAGVSDQLPSDGDAYLDRDTYELGVNALVNEVEVRLSWVEDGVSDLDVLLFVANDPSAELSLGAGSLVSRAGLESLTSSVSPGGLLWVWVGRANPGDNIGAALPPVEYQLSVCARQNL